MEKNIICRKVIGGQYLIDLSNILHDKKLFFDKLFFLARSIKKIYLKILWGQKILLMVHGRLKFKTIKILVK